MNIVLDPIYVVNLVLCIVILALGVAGWRRSGNAFSLYIGIAFGLFGLSHLATILGLKHVLEGVLIGVRTLGYLFVVFALFKITFRSQS
ncbi:MAG: hypothetical protein ACMUIM_01675 [bacterium]